MTEFDQQATVVVDDTSFTADQAKPLGEQEFIWIGDKVYRTADVQRVFDTRIPMVEVEEGEDGGDDEGGGEEDG